MKPWDAICGLFCGLCETVGDVFRSESVPDSVAATAEQADWTNGFGTLNDFEVPASSHDTFVTGHSFSSHDWND